MMKKSEIILTFCVLLFMSTAFLFGQATFRNGPLHYHISFTFLTSLAHDNSKSIDFDSNLSDHTSCEISSDKFKNEIENSLIRLTNNSSNNPKIQGLQNNQRSQPGTNILNCVNNKDYRSPLEFSSEMQSNPGVPGRDMDIYLLIGQSNMGGRAPIPAADSQEIPNVFVLRGQDDWVRAKNPINQYSSIQGGSINKMNPGYTFSLEMRKEFPDKQIGLVSNARGATGLAQWMPGTRYYNEAVKRARWAMQYGTIKGVLWHQGEQDSKDPANIPVYLERIKRMITALRNDLNSPNLPFVAGEISQIPSSYRAFNQMIQDFPGILPKTALADSDGLTALDNVHFDTRSMKILGRRYAEKMISLLTSSSSCTIIPYVNINRSGWNIVNDAITLESGSEIIFGPQSQEFGYEGGNWSWSGPNGATHSGREWRITNIQANQAGKYTVSNTDQNGCTATLEFTVSMQRACSIVPYININDQGWSVYNTTVTVDEGDTVWFGPQSEEYGTNPSGWSWSGPGNFSSTSRGARISNIRSNQAGNYVVTNRDASGCTATFTYSVAITRSTLGGRYHIRNVETGEYLDSDAGGLTGQVRNPRGLDKQWNIRVSTEGFYFIDNAMDTRGPLAATPSLGLVRYLDERFNTTPYVNREWDIIPVNGRVFKFLCKDNRRGYIAARNLDQVVTIANGDDSAAHWELIPIDEKNPDNFTVNNEIEIFPVPNNGFFTIDFRGNMISNVVIYNLAGQKVFNKSLNNQNSYDSLVISENLVQGMYIVKVIDVDGNTFLKKMNVHH